LAIFEALDINSFDWLDTKEEGIDWTKNLID